MTPVAPWFWPAICGCLWAAGLLVCWWLATDPRNRKDNDR